MATVVTVRSVVLPKEHGSWSLAFEPVLLALLAAPSAAGGALAGAAAAGFLCRRPWKLLLTVPASDARRELAARWGALFALAAAGGLIAAAWAGSPAKLWPLLAAVPLGALFVLFDRRNEMRAAEAELAGSATFAILPAAFATLAGWPLAPALGLSALALARSLPTVLTVRAYLRGRKVPANRAAGEGASAPRAGWRDRANWPALVAAGFAALALAVLARSGWVPRGAVIWGLVLLARTGWLLSARAPDWPAKRVGMIEAGLGLAYCGTTGWLAGVDAGQ